jgi:hypothetical protein
MSCLKITTRFCGRFIVILYRYALPAVTIFLLMILAQVDSRQQLFGSGLIDFLARAYICVWLCILYVRLPNLSTRYRLFKGSTTKKTDVSSDERTRFIFGVLVLGVIFTFGTRWAVMEFLPILQPLVYPIAVLNGCLFSIPLIAQYEVFKR